MMHKSQYRSIKKIPQLVLKQKAGTSKQTLICPFTFRFLVPRLFLSFFSPRYAQQMTWRAPWHRRIFFKSRAGGLGV